MDEPEDVDKNLSEVPEKHQKAFEETAQQLEQTVTGFQKIQEIVTQIRAEELTLAEGQKQIDTIVDEYELPIFR